MTAVTTTITDNDAATVSIAATTNGDESGPVDGVFTVTLTNPASTDTVINYTVAGTATSGSDFAALAGSVTISAGSTAATINVFTLDDGLVEGTEDVSVTLTGIASGDADVSLGGTTSASINLLDNDAADWTISGDPTVIEGGNASYTVSLTGSFQNGDDASVDLSIANVDTTSSDYANFDAAVTSAVGSYAGPGSYAWDGTTLTFTATADGQTPAALVISLGAIDDVTVEADEDFTISLASPTSSTGANVNLGGTTAVTTTINDNDAATVSIAATTDGNETGPVAGVFTVSMTAPSATDTVVSYTVAGSAIGGSDFTPLSGTVTILAGNTSATIDVATIDDGLIEGSEDVSVTLTGIVSGDPTIAIGGTSNAAINLVDNDAASWTIAGDASVAESANAAYTVSLSGSFQSGEDASVNLGLADVDTTSSDYADFSAAVASAVAAYVGPGTYAWDGTALTWTATADGQTSAGLAISLGATDDATVEADEDFTISLANPTSATGASIGLGASTAVTTTITDNDTATVSVAATNDGDESGAVSGQFTVTITNPSSTDTVIDYTLFGTAVNGSDYTSVSGQVTILAGDTSAVVAIPTIDDVEIEGTETVDITLAAISSGDPQVSLGGTTAASIDLFDNDAGDWQITGDANVSEGADATYTVSVSGTYASGQVISVDLALADVDTASSDHADLNTAISAAVAAYTGPGTYSWVGPTLTWTSTGPNQTPADLIITLGATDDAAVEGNEDYTISLSNPVCTTGGSVTLGPSTVVTTTIFDDDAATVSIAATADGNEAGPSNGRFTVTLSTTSTTDTVVDYVVTGTANSGSDFVPLTGQVTILAGDTTATIDVPTIDDGVIEGDESVTVTLTGIASGEPSIGIGGIISDSINLVRQ